MKHIFLQNPSGASVLIVIFLGWGVPPEAFSDLRKSCCDILIVSGYGKTAAADAARLIAARQNAGDYNEIVVIGWSFGVKVASAFLADTSLNVTLRLAVNGTERHIDDNCGIPRRIFQGTLDGLNAASLRKFRLRTAGSAAAFDRYFPNIAADDEEVASLREELLYFSSLAPRPETPCVWDKAVIGEADRIFPAASQKNAWHGIDTFPVKDMPHLPDFQWILDRFVIDKSRVGDRFSQASDTYADNAHVQQHVARRLFGLCRGEIPCRQLDVMEMGYGHGMFTDVYLLEMASSINSLTLVDLDVDRSVGDTVSASHVMADVEDMHFARKYMTPQSLDVVFSSSMIQWLNSPASWIRRCAAALRQGGIIAASFYSSGTLREISELTGAGLQYPTVETLADVARDCGLEIITAVSECEILRFDTSRDALRHLKLTGVNGLPTATSAPAIRQLLRHWPLDSDGMATLTFCPAYLVVTKK